MSSQRERAWWYDNDGQGTKLHRKRILRLPLASRSDINTADSGTLKSRVRFVARQWASWHNNGNDELTLRLFIVQIGLPFLFTDCFNSDNSFVVLLPSPGKLVEPICALFLLLCGDIVQNPGPNENAIAEMFKMVKETNERCIRIEASQTSMSEAITELKFSRQSVSNSISDANERLQAAEVLSGAFQNWQLDMNDRLQIMGCVENETSALPARLDDAEDQSPRHSLLVYGIPDNKSEASLQSEKEITVLASDKLDLH